MDINAEIVEKLLPAFTTLGGALIGAFVAYLVARQQFKAIVLSKNRQEWIDKLRDLLAEFESIVYKLYAHVRLKGNLLSGDKGVAEVMRAHRIKSKVTLLINPKEPDHAALIDLMTELANAAARDDDDKDTKNFYVLNGKYIALAQSILKREWKRVKKGE